MKNDIIVKGACTDAGSLGDTKWQVVSVRLR